MEEYFRKVRPPILPSRPSSRSSRRSSPHPAFSRALPVPSPVFSSSVGRPQMLHVNPIGQILGNRAAVRRQKAKNAGCAGHQKKTGRRRSAPASRIRPRRKTPAHRFPIEPFPALRRRKSRFRHRRDYSPWVWSGIIFGKITRTRNIPVGCADAEIRYGRAFAVRRNRRRRSTTSSRLTHGFARLPFGNRRNDRQNHP